MNKAISYSYAKSNMNNIDIWNNIKYAIMQVQKENGENYLGCLAFSILVLQA